MSFSAQAFRQDLHTLASAGVWLGTSSWKYAGWQGMVYDRDRYVYRGKYSDSRFERLCLSEYSEFFKTVCVDAAYYQFPTPRWLESMTSQVPPDFKFALKVTDQVTIKRFPKLDRFGPKAGIENELFLNADEFQRQFLEPCTPYQHQIGLLIFEFSRFYLEDFPRGRDFVAALAAFLEKIPSGWRYGVEIRNRYFLKDEYFSMLAAHGVTHVFNSWQDMPPIQEQILLPGAFTTPDLVAARLLLRPGRKYEEAVKLFAPYDQIKDPYPEGQEAGAKLVQAVRGGAGKQRGYIYVNNRFEGNAIQTIAGVMERVQAADPF